MPNRKTTILIIDDDGDLRAELAEQIVATGEFVVHEAATASEGVARAKEGGAGLILLDLDLSDQDGRDTCRALRAHGIREPIIMLTGRAEDSATIAGLEAGANDYVTKPFRFNVLLARIRAHLRNHENSEDAVFQVGPYEFRPSAKVLVGPDQRKVRLTEKETNILKYLYRSGEKPVPRDELLREVWGYNANITTHTLETHIYRLRQKIEPDGASPKILITEAGGYRLQIERVFNEIQAGQKS
jgi:DNA-binding response OmpR family regulator